MANSSGHKSAIDSALLNSSCEVENTALPVTSISIESDTNGVYYSCGNIVITPAGKFKFPELVAGIRFGDSKLLIFGRHTVGIYSTIAPDNSAPLSIFKISEFIFDVTIINSKTFALVDKCRVYQLNASGSLSTVYEGEAACMICAKFVLDGIAIGTFDTLIVIPLHFLGKATQDDSLVRVIDRAFGGKKAGYGKPYRYVIHKGRIFDVCYSNGNIYTCADDRTIAVNGQRLCQVYYNYFYRIVAHHGRVYGCNKDGYLYVYADGNGRLISKEQHGITVIEPCTGKDQSAELYIGYGNGDLESYCSRDKDADSNSYGLLPGMANSGNPNDTAEDGGNPIDTAEDGNFTYSLHRDHYLVKSNNKSQDTLAASMHNEGGKRVELKTISSRICKASSLYLQAYDNNGENAEFPLEMLDDSVFCFIKSHGDSIVLFNSSLVVKICKECHGMTHAISIPKISCVSPVGIGTKKGWVHVENQLYKISGSAICTIMDHYAMTSSRGMHSTGKANDIWIKAIDKNDIAHTFAAGILPNRDAQDIKARCDIQDIKVFRKPRYCDNKSRLSKIWFNNFTAQLTVNIDSVSIDNVSINSANSKHKVNNEYQLLGTSKGYLFLTEIMNIHSVVFLDQEINHIHALDDDRFFITAKTGKAFVVKKILNELFIEKERALHFRIVHSCGTHLLLSDGSIRYFDGELRQINAIKTEKYNTCMLAGIGTTGMERSTSISGIVFNSTSILEINEQNVLKTDLDLGAIWCAAYSKRDAGNRLYCAGDAQKIYSLAIDVPSSGDSSYSQNLVLEKSVIAHSAPIKAISVVGELVFTLGMDMHIGIFTAELEPVKYVQHHVYNPKVLKVESDYLTVYGGGIETIPWRSLLKSSYSNEVSMIRKTT